MLAPTVPALTSPTLSSQSVARAVAYGLGLVLVIFALATIVRRAPGA